jgi:hypothetical protein
MRLCYKLQFTVFVTKQATHSALAFPILSMGSGVHSATLNALPLYCESFREIYFSIPHSAEKAL